MYENSIYHPYNKNCGKVKLEWETLAQVWALTTVLGVKYLVLLNQSSGVLNQYVEEPSKPLLNPM